jgi:hypothetical protein
MRFDFPHITTNYFSLTLKVMAENICIFFPQQRKETEFACGKLAVICSSFLAGKYQAAF